jgi:hypothetical protein
MLKFPTSVSAILCAGLKEFEKLFGRNKECGFQGEKEIQNGQREVYTYKLFLGLLLRDFSKPLSQRQLPVVVGVDFAEGIFGRQVLTMFGRRINMISGVVLVCGYMLE